MDTLIPAPRGRPLSVYADPGTLALLTPWGAGRQRPARLGALCARYDRLARQPPELRLEEWAVVVQMLGGLATLDQARVLWAVLQDEARDGRAPPGIDPRKLAARLRALTSGELVAVLEIADRVARASGTIRERLAAADRHESGHVGLSSWRSCANEHALQQSTLRHGAQVGGHPPQELGQQHGQMVAIQCARAV
jgi:hypothetical protein